MYIKVQAPPSLAAREARNAPRGAKKTVYIYTLIYYTLYIHYIVYSVYTYTYIRIYLYVYTYLVYTYTLYILYFYIHIYTDILLILYIIGTLSN